MKLVDLLAAERILVPVQGKTLRLATAELVKALKNSGALRDTGRFEELVADTLPRDVVTVGQAFLLYFRTEAVPTLTVALGVAAEPMHREHDITKQARIVLLIAAPPKETSRFLRVVSAFSHALGRDEVVQGLLRARGPEEILQLEVLGQTELHGYLMVRDVMVRRRITIRPDMALGEAARTMVVHNVPSLIVVSDTNEVLGMVGHSELLKYLLPVHVKRLTGAPPAEQRKAVEMQDPYELPVREVMDRSVLCLSEHQTVAEVATMMLNRKIDRFPVVRDGVLVGFLSRGDIVRRLFGR
ncbi:MAG: CBS domain-containing protein [Gemmatimonadota bacterium]|nr:MAG: CBS domain-containing protein [Gemmatimonadota bacterium]